MGHTRAKPFPQGQGTFLNLGHTHNFFQPSFHYHGQSRRKKNQTGKKNYIKHETGFIPSVFHPPHFTTVLPYLFLNKMKAINSSERFNNPIFQIFPFIYDVLHLLRSVQGGIPDLTVCLHFLSFFCNEGSSACHQERGLKFCLYTCHSQYPVCQPPGMSNLFGFAPYLSLAFCL